MGLLRPVKNTIRVAEASEWIRTPSGLLRPVNG